jgi:hypothetical protein
VVRAVLWLSLSWETYDRGMPLRQRTRREDRWRRRMLLCAVVALCAALGWPLAPRAASQHTEALLVVVVHPSLNVGSLDERELQMIFLRRRLTWNDGTRVLPFNYPAGHPLRVEFDRLVLGFDPEQTARYWIDARIRAGSEAPRSLGTPALATRVVTQLRGSIAYVPVGESTAGLRVVARVSRAGVTAP